MKKSKLENDFRMFKYGCFALLILMFRFSGFDVKYGNISLLRLANQLIQLAIGLWMGTLVFRIGIFLNWKLWQKLLGAIGCLFQPTAFLLFFILRRKIHKTDLSTAAS